MKNHFLVFLFLGFLTQAQQKPIILNEEVTRIITELASDKMQGREIFTPGIDSASVFIEKEFTKIGLNYYGDLKNYRQAFEKNSKMANNVIAIISGKSKANEFVVFSAHFDHLGMKNTGDDTIYNGANDDASGVTAVITLASYFKKLDQNERTLIFVAFTGEEVGGFGSQFFSKSIDADKVIAMFNIEMIGTLSEWGFDSAYITGFEKSDFGAILQKNLEGSEFKFYPDPYPAENLFYRSDNATLAKIGVPAHTISTSQMNDEPNYHQVTDEVSALKLSNMTEIIRAIALSSVTIINGTATPSRVKIRFKKYLKQE